MTPSTIMSKENSSGFTGTAKQRVPEGGWDERRAREYWDKQGSQTHGSISHKHACSRHIAKQDI